MAQPRRTDVHTTRLVVFVLVLASASLGRAQVPAPTEIQKAVEEAYAKYIGLREGKNADYIPPLARVDPNLFGIAVVTADGKVYTAGDVKTEVSIQSISKVFTMAQVIQEQGIDSVANQIGVDATGARFNSIIAVEGVRTVVGTGAPEMNPLVNPGAISTTSMVKGATADEVWKKIIGFHNDAAGQSLSVLQDVYQAESDTNQRNRAIGALMLAYGYIKTDWQQAVDLYTRQSSIGVNTKDLAMMAATLATGGRNPVTGKPVLDADKVPGVLAVMATAGLYDDSGKWLYRTGLPAKSGVSGALIAVSPGKFGIAVVSPPLDDAGNSVRAQRAISDISNALGGNPFMAAPSTARNPAHALVRIFFATDRMRDGRLPNPPVYGSGRGSVSYGSCDVSIPREHRLGELERNAFITKLLFGDSGAVSLTRVNVQTKDAFLIELTQRVRSASKASALVFVHGFNVSFEEAARRTAQLSYDLAFEGATMFFSWPSLGDASLTSYMTDENNVEWARPHLQSFLHDVFNRSGAENVFIVAHSMGTRAVTTALSSLLKEDPSLSKRLKAVVLAAPDIDSDVFRRDLAPPLTDAGIHVTLYASATDRALQLSRMAHSYPRAGETGVGLVVMPGVETIDATGIDTSFLQHSYFADTGAVLGDMFYLIRNGLRASQRFLRAVDGQKGRYWLILSDSPQP